MYGVGFSLNFISILLETGYSETSRSFESWIGFIINHPLFLLSRIKICNRQIFVLNYR